jgi:hypothetical protein
VFVDGVNQYGPGAQYAYAETSGTVITFVTGLHVGASIKFTTTQINNAVATDAAQVSYTPAGTGAVATNVQDKLRQYVSVMDFGAVGDGVTDDTVAIQAAINSGAKYIDGFNPASTPYLITNTLTLGSGQTLDFGGSSIVAGDAATGLLASDGRHIQIRAAQNSAVKNLVILLGTANIFVPLKEWQPAVVISLSSNCLIENVVDQSRQGLGIGGSANYNKITKCWTNGKLHYSYDGGSYNIVSQNTVQTASIRGTGNNGISVGNIVDSNTLLQPDFMGIEDYSQYNPANPGYGVLVGTRITNNTIIGGPTILYFTISAVSPQAVIDGNTIYNAPVGTDLGANSYTVEIANNLGITATNNKICWDNATRMRVFQEVVIISAPAGGSPYDAPNIISNNTAVNCGTFLITQTVSGRTTVSGNTVRNCRQFILANKRLIIAENTIELNEAPIAARVLIQFTVGGVSGGSIINNNSITYAASLNGSAFAEFTIYTTVNDLIIDGNVIDGNSITAGGSAVTAIISNGQATTGMKAVNNIFLNGVQVNYGFMTNYVSANNTIPTLVSSTLNRTSFYDNQTLVTKQTITGSKGANAALASLLTALANAGLITDSTT